MGVSMVAVIPVQIPLSWLAARPARVAVFVGCYAVGASGLVLVPLANEPSLWLAICLFLFGACSGAMYPLGLALLGERVSASGLARAYAWYMAIECVGSQLGSAAMGKARDSWGHHAMFPVGLAAVLGVLATWGVLQVLRRRQDHTAPSLPSDKGSDSREAA